MIKKSIVFLLMLATVISCQSDKDKLEAKIAKIPVKVKVNRFDMEFAKAEPSDLPRLKEKFPFLFPERYPDSLWVAKMNDTIQQELNREVKKAFPDFKEQKMELHSLFQHMNYYFPRFKAPNVVTITSEVDYTNKVIAADSLLLISLDTYLGKDHKFYLGIQQYLRKNFTKDQLAPDIVAEYGRQLIPQPKSRELLRYMVYYGKILYLKDKILPKISDGRKIGYTPKEMEWAKANEKQIWQYFVEHELLYKTDSNLQSRFLNIGPFTKFGLQLDNESPPQLGQYIGWHIVRQYAQKHEDVPLEKLLKTDNETIFNESNYKPSEE